MYLASGQGLPAKQNAENVLNVLKFRLFNGRAAAASGCLSEYFMMYCDHEARYKFKLLLNTTSKRQRSPKHGMQMPPRSESETDRG